MSTPARPSNVYYLTGPEPVRPARRLPRRFVMRLKLVGLWWRLRATLVEVRGAVRRFGRPVHDRDDIGLDPRAELALAPVRRSGPARVIDLAAARQRRRALSLG
jgi:hypothetical protein